VQEKETANSDVLTNVSRVPTEGRILAIDPGMKRIGVAISDELRVTTRPLPLIQRQSWKKLLQTVKQSISDFDAQALVIGLPLESDGSESPMSLEAREMARKFALSLNIPVVLQDERVTSYEAKSRLWERGADLQETRKLVDSEAAAIILSDFLERISRK